MSVKNQHQEAIIASLIAQQEAFYHTYAERFRILFEEKDTLVTLHVTVGDRGVYAGEVEVGGIVFALLKNAIGSFYMLPAEDCYGTKEGQVLRVMLDNAKGPRLIAVSDLFTPTQAVNAPVQAAAPDYRSDDALIAELAEEQRVFFKQYETECAALSQQIGQSILWPVVPDCRGTYAGEVKLSTRIFAMLSHNKGGVYLLPAQNCYTLRKGQPLRVVLYRGEIFSWLIAIVDRPATEEGGFALEVNGKKQLELGVEEQDLEKSLYTSNKKKLKTLDTPGLSTSEKERDFEMEM